MYFGPLATSHSVIAMDKDTLCALLLLAIQDDAFETVRDSSIKDPDLTAYNILQLIHDRETSLIIKNGDAKDPNDTNSSQSTTY